MKRRKTVEDYLKTIYVLKKYKGEVKNADIARALNITPPTVCVALKGLKEEGYLYVDELHNIHLTEKGIEIAKIIYERNRMLQDLLVNLGVDEKTATKDACEMEHAISDKSYTAIKSMYSELVKEK